MTKESTQRPNRASWPTLLGGVLLAFTLPTLAGAVGVQDKHAVEAGAKRLDTPTLDRLTNEFQAVARVVEPSVVHIQVRKRPAALDGSDAAPDRALPPGFPDEFRRFFEAPRYRDEESDEGSSGSFRKFDVPPIVGTGSGWVFDASGTIVTNNHVVADAESITVKLYDGSQHEARVVAVDPSTDIAVLSIDAHDLTAAAVSTTPVGQGDIVFAFGSPMQFEFSMSQGVVAGMGRQTGILGPTGYESFIQTDAAINPGNSGGPLTNIHGEVVGMNTAIVSRSGFFSGMGFAIPSPMIRPVVEQLLDSGRVSRGYLGVLIQDDPLLLESFGFEGSGVVVSNVVADGPAAQAKLRAGDIVTSIDGKRVASSAELRQLIAAKQPGSVARVDLVRDGHATEADVTLGEIPGAEKQLAALGRPERRDSAQTEVLGKFGIERAKSMTAQLAERLGIEHSRGVLVEALRPTSVAAAAGLRSGDVICEVQAEAVSTPDELVAALARAKPEQALRLTVRSAGTQHFIVMKAPSEIPIG